jgi:hypothetical protein
MEEEEYPDSTRLPNLCNCLTLLSLLLLQLLPKQLLYYVLLLGLALSKLTSLVIAGKEGAHISISAMIFPNKPPKLVP